MNKFQEIVNNINLNNLVVVVVEAAAAAAAVVVHLTMVIRFSQMPKFLYWKQLSPSRSIFQ